MAVKLTLGLVLLAAVLYAGRQLARRALVPSFQRFGGAPSLADARAGGTLLAVYRATCAEGAPGVEAAYAEMPTRHTLGPLLQTRQQRSETVRITLRLTAADPSYRLAFEDGAGVVLDAETGRGAVPADLSPADLEEVSCCIADRSEVPERFWLLRDGDRRCTFERDRAHEARG